jgi:hypothetical protein
MSSSGDRNCIRTERQLGLRIPRGEGALQQPVRSSHRRPFKTKSKPIATFSVKACCQCIFSWQPRDYAPAYDRCGMGYRVHISAAFKGSQDVETYHAKGGMSNDQQAYETDSALVSTLAEACYQHRVWQPARMSLMALSRLRLQRILSPRGRVSGSYKKLY